MTLVSLVADSRLPAFDAMRLEGVPVTTPERVGASGLPSLAVGFLNLMPDAALRATDRQFLGLVAAAADRADVWFRPFTFSSEQRGSEARGHIDTHYTTFDVIRESGIDALIITGANPASSDLREEVFWPGLVEVIDWARRNEIPVVCSCLATHAALLHLWGITRNLLPSKCWGVYEHEVVDEHPLLTGVADPVLAPHSHRYDVTDAQIGSVGARILLRSREAGVHMAVSEDELMVFFQGHPEYDRISLLKEYQREVNRYYRRERANYPPIPDNYLDERGRLALEGHRVQVDEARKVGSNQPRFPTGELELGPDRDWTTPGKTIYRNWLRPIVDARTPARA